MTILHHGRRWHTQHIHPCRCDNLPQPIITSDHRICSRSSHDRHPSQLTTAARRRPSLRLHTSDRPGVLAHVYVHGKEGRVGGWGAGGEGGLVCSPARPWAGRRRRRRAPAAPQTPACTTRSGPPCPPPPASPLFTPGPPRPGQQPHKRPRIPRARVLPARRAVKRVAFRVFSA